MKPEKSPAKTGLTISKSALHFRLLLSLLKNFTHFSSLAGNKVLYLSAMNYPIPGSSQEITALRQKPINEELIATAIAGVVQIARSKGQSLEDLTAEVLADDSLLDRDMRHWLSEIVAQAWQTLP